MQSQPFSFRVLTVVITAAALSLAWMASGPAALPAAAGTAVTAAAALQDPTAPGMVVTVPPARLADSRIAQQISGPLPMQGTGTVQITGHAGVPASGVDAAVLTVTAVSPQAAGYLTVWPSGSTRTTTSNLNVPAGQTIATTVITPLGPDGGVQIFNGSAGTTDLVVDVTGYTRSGSPAGAGAVITVLPSRLADSRIAQQLSGPLPALGSGAVQITGHAGVPASGVDAAVLTVTAVSPQAAGYLTVWPTGSTRTTTSNLNFPAGQTVNCRIVWHLLTTLFGTVSC
jgi:hypothetical protein